MSLLNKFKKQTTKNLEENILENVADLLNTKKTFGAYDSELGLDSYFYASSNGQIIKQMMCDIKSCLNKYEKRIELLDIQSVPSENRFFLSFMIKCKIKSSSVSLHLSFHHQRNLFNVELKS